jgi:hypothetical protein
MVSELFIENQRADISADISSLLTFAIDDVKDFSTRSTTWSKTIVIPGTSRNNFLFGNIFETGIANDYDPDLDNVGINFNASKSARCLIFQDNIQTFKGTVRLLEIVKDKHRIEYEIALNGELTGLNVALSSGFLKTSISAHTIIPTMKQAFLQAGTMLGDQVTITHLSITELIQPTNMIGTLEPSGPLSTRRNISIKCLLRPISGTPAIYSTLIALRN